MDALISLDLAERVANAAYEVGIQTALIGAAALAIHHYIRGTEDVDMATYVDPYGKLKELESVLTSLGLHTKLNLPDGDDSLGGVLNVWEHEDEDGDPLEPVQVVNFYNPHRAGSTTPALAAIKNAILLDEHTANLKYVRLSDLVALKLFARSRRDSADIVELLVLNPSADREEIRKVAGPYGQSNELEELIQEADLRVSKSKPR